MIKRLIKVLSIFFAITIYILQIIFITPLYSQFFDSSGFAYLISILGVPCGVVFLLIALSGIICGINNMCKYIYYGTYDDDEIQKIKTEKTSKEVGALSFPENKDG